MGEIFSLAFTSHKLSTPTPNHTQHTLCLFIFSYYILVILKWCVMRAWVSACARAFTPNPHAYDNVAAECGVCIAKCVWHGQDIQHCVCHRRRRARGGVGVSVVKAPHIYRWYALISPSTMNTIIFRHILCKYVNAATAASCKLAYSKIAWSHCFCDEAGLSRREHNNNNNNNTNYPIDPFYKIVIINILQERKCK